MARATAAALVLALLAAGCAFRRGDPLPADPPRDFLLRVEVHGVDGWPWEGWIRFEAAAGSAEYDVAFPGPPPATRRGCEAVDGAALREVWAAAGAAGLFARVPAPAAGAAAPLVVEGCALRLDGRVSGDPAAEPALAALLEAVRRAAPVRILRPPPGPGRP